LHSIKHLPDWKMFHIKIHVQSRLYIMTQFSLVQWQIFTNLSFPLHKGYIGHAIAQAVSYWLHTAAARVWAQVMWDSW
jgi:hypothetical protein